MDKIFKKDVKILIVEIIACICLTVLGYFIGNFMAERQQEQLPQRIEAVLTEADSQDEENSKTTIQEVRMAQLVEYEIPNMEEDEIFLVVKSKDGAIVRTTINKDLAEALLEYYK